MARPPRTAQTGGRPGAGRVRIVAGKWRGRLLPVPDLPGLRPSSARVRETLFNWLAPRIEGSRCLDLCAGSGALGFEALSRGAAAAVLVDSSPAAVRTLRQAADELGADAATIVQADARRWLEAGEPQRFDVVFLDPPYRDGLLPELCRLLVRRRWLAGDARVYLEWQRGETPPELPDGWEPLRDKTAGAVRYQLVAAGEAGT